MLVQREAQFPLGIFIGECVFEEPTCKSVAFNNHAAARSQRLHRTCRQMFQWSSRSEGIGYEVKSRHSGSVCGPRFHPIFSRLINHRIHLLKAAVAAVIGVWNIVTRNEAFYARPSCSHAVHVVQVLGIHH